MELQLIGSFLIATVDALASHLDGLTVAPKHSLISSELVEFLKLMIYLCSHLMVVLRIAPSSIVFIFLVFSA